MSPKTKRRKEMLMKTSTEIGSAAKMIGEEKAVELVAKAGFDGWDISMFPMAAIDYATGTWAYGEHPLGKNALAFARQLRKIGLDNGIVCNQSHAPFPSIWPDTKDVLLRAIECTAEAGGQICIIHPNNYRSAEENAEMFLALLPFAKEHHVKIATENMWNWNAEAHCAAPAACSDPVSFLAHLNAVSDEYLVACLDVGHAEMAGLGTSAVEMIHALGSHLQALHLHDTNRRGDNHQIPFSMQIDFAAIVRALREIDYAGWFTLEADTYLRSAYTPETIFQGIRNLSKAARRLAKLYDEVRI